MFGYMIIFGLFTLLGVVLKNKLQSTFNKYSRVPMSNGMSGKEVAESMLRHYGIHDVKIVPGKGSLTDHYNPLTKTIALSEPVYGVKSVAAAAVAAHECGHAVQHAAAYPFLKMRSALVPVLKLTSGLQQYLFLGLMFAMQTSLGQPMMYIFAGTFAATAIFSLVTLPVEFDASKRALAYIDNAGIVQSSEYDGAKDSLWWAAMTYVCQALASIAMFVYFFLQARGSRR